ncbi:MAG: hypothetical protein WAM60_06030 [Candidatus Promineifilaceae bacterium]
MSDPQTSPLPRQIWRILGLAAVLLLILTVSAISLISAGFFDPKPVGKETAELPLQTESIPAHTQTLRWLDERLTADSFSLRLTAAYQSGDLDSGYGLAFGGDDGALVVAVSPLGNAAVFQPGSLSLINNEPDNLDGMIANRPLGNSNDGVFVWPSSATSPPETPLLEWQPWPHVHTHEETNEIWLDKRGEELTIRINRELFWTGRISIPAAQIGLWSAAFNEATVIDFENLAIFEE